MKYVLPPILVDGIRGIMAEGYPVESSSQLKISLELASAWQTPVPSHRDGRGVFDFAAVMDSLDRAMASPIVRDNLTALAHIGVEEAALLDFGCADGRYRLLLQSYPSTAKWRYVGADISVELIKFCINAHNHTRFELLVDGNPLPFRDDEFDVVLASGVLQSIRDYPATLSELRRVSRGYVLISRLPVWKYHDGRIALQRVQDGINEGLSSRYIFNRAALENEFARVGFSIIERDYGSEIYYVRGVSEAVIFNTYLLKKTETTSCYQVRQ